MNTDDIPMISEREAGMPEHVPAVGVGFGLNAVEDEAKSTEAGRKIFKEVEFVKIMVPGDKQSVFLQPATAQHRQRFPRAYAMFKQLGTMAVEGTPIETWPMITRAEAMTLKANNVLTLEMLCDVHDGNLGKLGFNARELQAKARAYLANAKDSAAAQKFAVEAQRKDEQIAELQRQINDLATRLDKDAKLGPMIGAKKVA
jgi:hypothetical protein